MPIDEKMLNKTHINWFGKPFILLRMPMA